jgi:hypothetical protein
MKPILLTDAILAALDFAGFDPHEDADVTAIEILDANDNVFIRVEISPEIIVDVSGTMEDQTCEFYR